METNELTDQLVNIINNLGDPIPENKDELIEWIKKCGKVCDVIEEEFYELHEIRCKNPEGKLDQWGEGELFLASKLFYLINGK